MKVLARSIAEIMRIPNAAIKITCCVCWSLMGICDDDGSVEVQSGLWQLFGRLRRTMKTRWWWPPNNNRASRSQQVWKAGSARLPLLYLHAARVDGIMLFAVTQLRGMLNVIVAPDIASGFVVLMSKVEWGYTLGRYLRGALCASVIDEQGIQASSYGQPHCESRGWYNRCIPRFQPTSVRSCCRPPSPLVAGSTFLFQRF